jgi:gluconolactonase
VAKTAGRPNGIALSPNGRVLYVVNSDDRNVRAYDLDRAGEPSNERVLIAKIGGVPGGIRTDEQGNLYVAGKGVSIYAADGRLIHTLELKAPAANCGFGEPDGRTLFITSGPEVLRARLDVKGAY